jgi:peptide chain release factor 3
MEEIERVLGIRSCPVNWPIGIHGDFKGVYHRDAREVELYKGGDHGQRLVEVRHVSIDDPGFDGVLGKGYADKLREDDRAARRRGAIRSTLTRSCRVSDADVFRSASNNFGVEPFLQRF